jgi:hypothetical protein
MGWAGHAACIGEEICLQGLMGKPERRRPLGRRSINGVIILKWILNE